MVPGEQCHVNSLFATAWPPTQDCVAVEELIHRRFEASDGPSGLIVYVGQRAE